MKIALEVEGRLKGLKSLFVEKIEELDTVSVEKLRGLGVVHVAIMDLAGQLDYSHPVFAELDAAGFYITVECRARRPEMPDYINVVLDIQCPEFFNLKDTDQIKFVDANRNVFMVTPECMIKSTEADFAGDKEIAL